MMNPTSMKTSVYPSPTARQFVFTPGVCSEPFSSKNLDKEVEIRLNV